MLIDLVFYFRIKYENLINEKKEVLFFASNNEKLKFTPRNSLSHNLDNYLKNEHKNYFKYQKQIKIK